VGEMAEAAFTIVSSSLTACMWAALGGFTWMLIFYCAIPAISKWNTYGLLSNEAAARAETLRALRQLRSPAPTISSWS